MVTPETVASDSALPRSRRCGSGCSCSRSAAVLGSLIGYALVLALVAGILEIVPYIGPVVSAVIAISVSFLHSPITGLLVLGLFVLVQQLEGYVFTPLVMKKAVGLNPVVVILALMIGAKLGGVMGIIVAVPVAAVAGEIVNDLVRKPEASEGKEE